VIVLNGLTRRRVSEPKRLSRKLEWEISGDRIATRFEPCSLLRESQHIGITTSFFGFTAVLPVVLPSNLSLASMQSVSVTDEAIVLGMCACGISRQFSVFLFLFPQRASVCLSLSLFSIRWNDWSLPGDERHTENRWWVGNILLV
jgi:hypothetical protein